MLAVGKVLDGETDGVAVEGEEEGVNVGGTLGVLVGENEGAEDGNLVGGLDDGASDPNIMDTSAYPGDTEVSILFTLTIRDCFDFLQSSISYVSPSLMAAFINDCA